MDEPELSTDQSKNRSTLQTRLRRSMFYIRRRHAWSPPSLSATKRTMFQLFEQLLLHLQQEVVVVLHVLGRVHHQSAHQVGAVRLVADPHGTCDGTKVHVVLITGREDEMKPIKGAIAGSASVPAEGLPRF